MAAREVNPAPIKNKKGKTLAEYPKLVRVGERKVRVFSKEEEDKLTEKEEKKSAGGWNKD